MYRGYSPIDQSDVKPILDSFHFGIGLILSKKGCTDVVEDIKSLMSSGSSNVLDKIEKIVNRRDIVDAIVVPIGLVSIPTLVKRTTLAKIEDMVNLFDIKSIPAEADMSQKLPIINLTAKDAYDTYISYTRLFYPFYTLLREIEELINIHGSGDIRRIVDSRIAAGVKQHVENSRTKVKLYYGEQVTAFNYDEMDFDLNVEDPVNKLIDLTFKVNYSYDKNDRDFPSAFLEVGALMELIKKYNLLYVNREQIAAEFKTLFSIPYFVELSDLFDHSLYRMDIIKSFRRNIIKYETSYYFDKDVKDITNDNPMIIPLKYTAYLDNITDKDYDDILNKIIGGYLYKLDMSKSLITGSVICATIQEAQRKNLKLGFEPMELAKVLYPNIYTRLLRYEEDEYLSLVVANSNYIKLDMEITVSEDHRTLMCKIPKLSDIDSVDIDTIEELFDSLNIEGNFELANRILNNDPERVYKFSIVPGVDTDIGIDTEDDEEFDQIANSHFNVIKEMYPKIALHKRVRQNGSYIYEIKAEDYVEYFNGFRDVQLFKCNRLTIAKFHLPMVRGWRDNTPGIKATATCGLSFRDYTFRNIHFFKTQGDRLKILAKYNIRGFINKTSFSNKFYQLMTDKYKNGEDFRTKIYASSNLENIIYNNLSIDDRLNPYKYLQFDYNLLSVREYSNFDWMKERNVIIYTNNVWDQGLTNAYYPEGLMTPVDGSDNDDNDDNDDNEVVLRRRNSSDLDDDAEDLDGDFVLDRLNEDNQQLSPPPRRRDSPIGRNAVRRLFNDQPGPSQARFSDASYDRTPSSGSRTPRTPRTPISSVESDYDEEY